MNVKKSMLSLATVAAIVAPIVAVVSCASPHTESGIVKENEVVVGYKPDLDPLLALGAPIGATPESDGWKGFPDGNKNPNISKYQEKMDKMAVNKPLWDGDNMDEEYWRSLAGKSKYILAPEQWIKTPQKDFIDNDPIVQGAFLDYNDGYAHEVYNMPIEGGGVMKLENRTDKNYDDPNDIWQIRSMDQIVRGAAKSLDKYYDKIDFASRAENVISVTNDHWNQLNFLRKGQEDKFTWKNDTKALPLADDQEETLLVLNFNEGDTTMQNVSISTPSEIRGAYVKGQFKMPEFTKAQASTIESQKRWLKDGATNYKAVISDRAGNGIAISGTENAPLNSDFWSDWNGKVDKIVVGIPNDSMESQDTIDSFWNKHKAIKSGIKNLLKSNSEWDKSVVSVSNNIAGKTSYWNRMPLGQNAMIDSMIDAWYKPADDASEDIKKIYNDSKVWSFEK